MHPHILVIRLSSLGDIVLTLPVYKNLKAHWPHCRISVLVKPQYASVLEGNPCIDEVIPFRGLFDAISRIRHGEFTHLLDLHSTFRSFILRTFSGVANTARYRKDALARRLFVTIRLPSPALTKHNIDRYLESLSAWGVPTPVRDIHIEDYGVGSEKMSSPKRILIVQTAFLGDATLTLPLAREIKKTAPDCHLTMLTRPDTADVFRSSDWIDETMIDDKRGKYSGARGLLSLSRTLKAGNFDLALVPHRSLRSALAVWLAHIPTRIGFSSSAGRFLFTRTIPFTWGMHDLERNLGLLLPFHSLTKTAVPNAVFGAPSETSPRTAVPNAVFGATADDSVYLRGRPAHNGATTLAQRLEASGIAPGVRLIGVHPGSVWPTKRWPADRYTRLIRDLKQETKASIVLVGGKGDAELASQIARDSGAPVLDWCGKTTLSELIELMGHLSLFITNDSGPMHIATASGVPTLAIFGPTTRELGFFPYGPKHRVLEVDLSCRPCGLHGAKTCPEGHFLCMRLISVDQVFRCAVDMLQLSVTSEGIGLARQSK